MEDRKEVLATHKVRPHTQLLMNPILYCIFIRSLYKCLFQRELQRNLRDSKDLASEYRTLQNKYVKKKNELFNMMDAREKLEVCIKDLKQVGD